MSQLNYFRHKVAKKPWFGVATLSAFYNPNNEYKTNVAMYADCNVFGCQIKAFGLVYSGGNGVDSPAIMNPTLESCWGTHSGVFPPTNRSGIFPIMSGYNYLDRPYAVVNYYRLYVTTAGGTAYSNVCTYIPIPIGASLPTVRLDSITSITTTSANLNGTLTFDGNDVTTVGFCYGLQDNPTRYSGIPGSGQVGFATTTTSGTSFQCPLSNLTPNAVYYVRAWAINSAGTVYSSSMSFTASNLNVPTPTIYSVSNITTTSGKFYGRITNDGGSVVTQKGFCWNTTGNPHIDTDSYIDCGAGNLDFESVISGLTPGTKYYINAFARNSIGVGYGADIQHFTTAVPSIDSSINVHDITSNSASVDCVWSGNGYLMTGGGVVLGVGENSNPTKESNINRMDISSSLFGYYVRSGGFSYTNFLQPNTTYCARIYVETGQGTTYPQQFNFTTTP